MSIETSLELNTIISEMCNYTSFSCGKKLVSEIRPSYNKLIIQQENNRMREALQSCITYGACPIEGFHDIRDVLEDCNKGRTLSSYDLLKVLQEIQ